MRPSICRKPHRHLTVARVPGGGGSLAVFCGVLYWYTLRSLSMRPSP